MDIEFRRTVVEVPKPYNNASLPHPQRQEQSLARLKEVLTSEEWAQHRVVSVVEGFAFTGFIVVFEIKVSL